MEWVLVMHPNRVQNYKKFCTYANNLHKNHDFTSFSAKRVKKIKLQMFGNQ